MCQFFFHRAQELCRSGKIRRYELNTSSAAHSLPASRLEHFGLSSAFALATVAKDGLTHCVRLGGWGRRNPRN
jgi:hypothetical protein